MIRSDGVEAPETMIGTIEGIGQSLAAERFADTRTIRIGSWTLNLYASRGEFVEALVGLFPSTALEFVAAQPLRSVPAVYCLHAGFCPALDAVVGAGNIGHSPPPDGFVTSGHQNANVFVLRTEAVGAVVVQGHGPARIYFSLDPGRLPPNDFNVHLSVALNRMFFALGRLVLHAGAVGIGDRAVLLIGGRGAGKSTACVRFGAAGATILADDHVLLARDNGGFLVSGCGGHARVTAKTEASFLAGRLDEPPRDYAGLLKKEFRLDRFFPSDPNRDYPVGTLLFLSLGDRFDILDLARHEAVPAFMSQIRSALRFNDANDFTTYLAYVAHLIGTTRSFRIQLSSDLRDLDRLVTFFAP